MVESSNLQVMSPRAKRSNESLFTNVLEQLSPHRIALEHRDPSPLSKMCKTGITAVGDDLQPGSSSSISITVTKNLNQERSATISDKGIMSEAELKNVILELEQQNSSLHTQGQQYVELQQERFRCAHREYENQHMVATREYELRSRAIA